MKKSFFSELWVKVKGVYKNNKKLFFTILLCVVAVIFLMCSSFLSINGEKVKKSEEKKVENISGYAEKIEDKLISLLSKIDSVKTIDVMVVVESELETKYLTETTEKTISGSGTATTETSTTVVFQKDGSILTPVVVTTICPKVSGVLIITNKISQSVKNTIILSVSTVLGIGEEHISLIQQS